MTIDARWNHKFVDTTNFIVPVSNHRYYYLSCFRQTEVLISVVNLPVNLVTIITGKFINKITDCFGQQHNATH